MAFVLLYNKLSQRKNDPFKIHAGQNFFIVYIFVFVEMKMPIPPIARPKMLININIALVESLISAGVKLGNLGKQIIINITFVTEKIVAVISKSLKLVIFCFSILAPFCLN